MLTRRFLTVKEVADLVQVSEASVRHWIKLRQLRAIDLGREWRVVPRDLEVFLAAHATCRTTPPPADAGGGPTLIPARRGEASANPLDDLLQPGGSRRSHASDAATPKTSRSKEKRDASA